MQGHQPDWYKCPACKAEKWYCPDCEQPAGKCPHCDAEWVRKHERLEGRS